jgi:stress-induced morphogen
MPMSADDIIAHIKIALPDAEVEMTDLAGDNNHWAAKVTSDAFKGLPRVRQHQLVYQSLGDKMGGILHALQLTTQPRG